MMRVMCHQERTPRGQKWLADDGGRLDQQDALRETAFLVLLIQPICVTCVEYYLSGI